MPGIVRLARSRAAADLAVTAGTRGVSLLLALVGNVASARALGPSDFGRFGIIMATVMICGTLADMGLNQAALRYIAREREEGDPHDAARVYLVLRPLSGAIVTLLGLLFSAPLADVLLGHAEIAPYLQLAFLTLLGLSISSYPGTVLLGLGLFGRLGTAAMFNAAITVGGILALWLAGRLDLGTLVAWNVLVPLASSVPAWLLLPREWLPWRLAPGGVPSLRLLLRRGGLAWTMLGFGKWMGLATLGSIVVAQADVLLLGRFSTPETLGVYSVALALAMRLDALNQSLITVMLPRANRLQGQADMRGYSRRVLRGSLWLAVALGASVFLAQPLIELLYGESYRASAGLFVLLLGVVLFDLATSSLFLVALPLEKPQILAVAEWLRVATILAAGWLLIPVHAAWGAAISRLLSRVAGAAYNLLALHRALNAAPTTQGESHLDNSPDV
ncbi:MAG TPA: oligosaccharide flippase family protein [Chloroflexia bacterium]|nr:oligosaccharide flippase family protein [Chloroflexia bacterium]